MADLTESMNLESVNKKKFGCLQVLGIVLLTVVVTAGLTFWAAKTYIFPGQFKPVTLTVQENQILSEKLDSFDFAQSQSTKQSDQKQKTTTGTGTGKP